MRKGINPQKLEKKLELDTYHRIIVVVYIPNEEGFYKSSFDVFKMCIESILKSMNSNAVLTVVNNGSCKKVADFLNIFYLDNKIDTLISHKKNIGKIDAIIGAARGAREKYITLSDSDILFMDNWQENVEAVFSKFKNVGSVSPIPVREGYLYGTTTVLKTIILKQLKFKFEKIPENFEDYNKYMKSINWNLERKKDCVWPVISKNGFKAIVGSGHQVMTIDRDILFKTTPTNPSLTLVGNNSEYNYVDVPIDKAGKLRLSTYNNFAFHMGNELETWMIEKYKQNSEKPVNSCIIKQQNIHNKNLFYSFVSNKFFSFQKKIIKSVFTILYVK